MAPPSTSSAFSSTSWIDFFVFSKTGNLVVAGAFVLLLALLLLSTLNKRDI